MHFLALQIFIFSFFFLSFRLGFGHFFNDFPTTQIRNFKTPPMIFSGSKMHIIFFWLPVQFRNVLVHLISVDWTILADRKAVCDLSVLLLSEIVPNVVIEQLGKTTIKDICERSSSSTIFPINWKFSLGTLYCTAGLQSLIRTFQSKYLKKSTKMFQLLFYIKRPVAFLLKISTFYKRTISYEVWNVIKIRDFSPCVL